MQNNGVNGFDIDGRLNALTAFLRYAFRVGTDTEIQFYEIDTSSVKPSQFKAVKSILDVCRKGEHHINDSMSVSTGDTSFNQSLYLGYVTLKLNGDLFVVKGGYWRFAGELSCADDTYDFNPSTHRSWIAEALTRFGAAVPGKTYKIAIAGTKPIWEYGNCCKTKRSSK